MKRKLIILLLITLILFPITIYSCEIGPDSVKIEYYKDIEGKHKIKDIGKEDYYEFLYFGDKDDKNFVVVQIIFYDYENELLLKESLLDSSGKVESYKVFEYAKSGLQLSKKYFNAGGTLNTNFDEYGASIVLFLYNYNNYLVVRVSYDRNYITKNISTLELVSDTKNEKSFLRKKSFRFENNALYNCLYKEYRFPNVETYIYNYGEVEQSPFKLSSDEYNYNKVLELQKYNNFYNNITFGERIDIKESNPPLHYHTSLIGERKYTGDVISDFDLVNNISFGGIRRKETYKDGKIIRLSLLGMSDKLIELNNISFITWKYKWTKVIEKHYCVKGEVKKVRKFSR